MTRRFFIYFFLAFLCIVVSMVLGGLVSHFAGPGLALLVLIVLMAGSMICLAISFNRPSGADQALAATGTEAEAVITGVKDTGVSTGGDLNYVVRLILRVEPQGGAPFVSEAEVTASRVSVPPAGGRVTVKYDPAKPSHAVVVGAVRVGGMSDRSASQPVDTAAVLDDMKGHGLDEAVDAGQSLIYSTGMSPQQAGLLLQAANEQFLELGETGIGVKAVVIEVHPLGVMVNGNNQGVTIKVTVMPEDGEPYPAEATGVIGEKSWPYYQAGHMIWVKCDPTDKMRVSFWKSLAPEAG